MTPNLQSSVLRAGALLALCSLAANAMAHPGAFADTPAQASAAASFFAGFTHPLTGLDHLAAMLSVGLWGALTARRSGPEMLWGPLAFAVMLWAGAVAGWMGVALPAVEPMVAASVLVLGLLVLARRHAQSLPAFLLIALFGIFHGAAHGYELAGSPFMLASLAGMLSASLALHAVGLALGWALRRAPIWTVRLAGMAVVALGAGLLAPLVLSTALA